MKVGLTSAQTDLLLRLIIEDRIWRSRKEQGESVSIDDRGIEISWIINGIKRSTALALVDAGLAELVNIRGTQKYLFLGRYEPYDDV